MVSTGSCVPQSESGEVFTIFCLDSFMIKKKKKDCFADKKVVVLQTETKEVLLLCVKMSSDVFSTSALNSLGFL